MLSCAAVNALLARKAGLVSSLPGRGRKGVDETARQVLEEKKLMLLHTPEELCMCMASQAVLIACV